MKRSSLLAVAAVMLLSSCHKIDEANPEQQRPQGRYAGVGVYDAGPLWSKMLDAPNPDKPQTATIRDDEHIIVVVDSRTGEIRQCGDHSGYCVAVSPWNAARPIPGLPAKLSVHAEDKAKADSSFDQARSAK